MRHEVPRHNDCEYRDSSKEPETSAHDGLLVSAINEVLAAGGLATRLDYCVPKRREIAIHENRYERARVDRMVTHPAFAYTAIIAAGSAHRPPRGTSATRSVAPRLFEVFTAFSRALPESKQWPIATVTVV